MQSAANGSSVVNVFTELDRADVLGRHSDCVRRYEKFRLNQDNAHIWNRWKTVTHIHLVKSHYNDSALN